MKQAVPLLTLLVGGLPHVARASPLTVEPERVLEGAGAIFDQADLAVTADGTVHVVVADNVSDEVSHLHDGEGTWSEPFVISAWSDSGPANLEVAVGPDDLVHAVFDPGPGDTFAHAVRSVSGDWDVDDLESGARWLRFVLDDDGALHGVYSDGGLDYGTDASGTWATERVRLAGSFAERNPVLRFDGGATPVVGFVDKEDFSNPAVRLARKVDDAWTFETVSAQGDGPLGLTHGGDGALHAVFAREDEEGGLTWVHATRELEGWTEEPVVGFEASGVSDGSPLDVEAIGEDLVWADAEGGLRLHFGRPGAWRTFETDLDARVVRLVVDGERLLVMVVDAVPDVHLVELSLTDADADGVPEAFDGCPELADPGAADGDADGVGDACDCGDDGACTAWTDEGGWCDGTSAERTDADCDLCAIGPDGDEDGVTDACDACPADPERTEAGPGSDPCAEEAAAGTCGCSAAGAGGGAVLGGLVGLVGWAGRRQRR